MRGPEFYEPELGYPSSELRNTASGAEPDVLPPEVDTRTGAPVDSLEQLAAEEADRDKAPENPYTGAISPYEAA